MPRKKKFEQTEVIQKAKHLFWEFGYEGTSMQMLVDTLGMNRSSMYMFLGDKMNLYCNTLEIYSTETADRLVEKANDAVNPRQFIIELFTEVLDGFGNGQENKGCYMLNASVEFASREPRVTEIIEKHTESYLNSLSYLIQLGQERRQLSGIHNPRTFAKYLFTNILGLNVAARKGVPASEMKTVVDLITRSF